MTHSVIVAPTVEVKCMQKEHNLNCHSNQLFQSSENHVPNDGIHGSIPFLGITRETKAKFMLLSEKKPPVETWQLMKDKWDMTKPSLVISVIGGAKDFNLDDRLEASLKATVHKASQLPGSYITTGGAYTGIMKIVSDAAEDSSGVCLGISAWNAIVNRELSIRNDKGYPYVVGSWLAQNGLYLDYKHSHFILVKEEIKGMGESLFRASLERHLIDTFNIPAVLLVVNGGSGTLDFLYEVIMSSSFPIVVVEKSGRVADLLAHALNSWEEVDALETDGGTHECLYKYMKQVMLDTPTTNAELDESTRDWLDMCYMKLMKCLEKRELFSVATMGTTNDIDAAIINGLLAGKQKDTFERLKLTLLWDRPDYARSVIFSSNVKVEVKQLEYVMVMALSHGNQEYVKLLMDYGVNMHELLTKEILEFLYGYQAYEDNFLYRKYINFETDGYACNYIEESDRKSRKSLNAYIIQEILNTKMTKRFLDNEILIFACSEGGDRLIDPFWELFIWAVFCNLQEMAKFLWPFGRDQMSKALIASEIWHVMGTYDGKRHRQATISLNKGSKMFKGLAYELLDECCTTDEKLGIKLCTTTQRHMMDMTCLDIAVAVNHYDFVAHSSIQMLRADVWTGFLTTRKVGGKGYFKIFLAIVFPFLILREINLFPGRIDAEAGQKLNTSEYKRRTIVGDFFRRLLAFYFHTPVVTFVLHVFSCLFFLIIYSYVVILGKVSVEKSVLEMILVLWVFGYMVGEIYQLIQYRAKTWKMKLLLWLSSSLNKIDLFNIFMFFIAWGLSFGASTLPVAHTLHAINCGFWILRLCTVMRVRPKLSLYLEMIKKMSADLFWFLFILLAFVLAYGVTSTALLFPGVPNPVLCLDMLLRSWFNIFGEHFIEMPPEAGQTHLTSPRYNSYDEYVAWFLMGVYLLLTNILLLNIIIAAFNTTYANVEAIATNMSKFRKHDLVVEFSRKASTPPPLSLLHHFCLLLVWVYQCLCCIQAPRMTSKLHRCISTVSSQELEEMQEFEYYSAVRVHAGKTGAEEDEESSSPSHSTSENVLQCVEVMIEKMEERMTTAMNRMESKVSRLAQQVDLISKSS